MTKFVVGMNQMAPGQEAVLPPSDSRCRPDLRMLEHGRVKEVMASVEHLQTNQCQCWSDAPRHT